MGRIAFYTCHGETDRHIKFQSNKSFILVTFEYQKVKVLKK